MLCGTEVTALCRAGKFGDENPGVVASKKK
jgi:hypothetical protein